MTGVSEGREPRASRLGIAGWMLFDWAAQPFFTVITTFIFGPYLVSRLAADPAAGQAAWSYTLTIAGIAIAEKGASGQFDRKFLADDAPEDRIASR